MSREFTKMLYNTVNSSLIPLLCPFIKSRLMCKSHAYSCALKQIVKMSAILKCVCSSIFFSYENAFLVSQLHDQNEAVFIGFTDRMHERTFLWEDQTTVNYLNWDKHQPSRYGDEDCVELMPFYKTHGRWNDINCDLEHGFVCQARM